MERKRDRASHAERELEYNMVRESKKIRRGR